MKMFDDLGRQIGGLFVSEEKIEIDEEELEALKELSPIPLVWKSNLGDSEVAVFSLAYDDGALYAADEDGELIRFDSASGEQLWRNKTKHQFSGGVGVGDGVVGRGHFAQVLQHEGLVKNSQQAFERYLKKGKAAYVASEWPELEKVVKWITEAEGVAVIAHPAIYKFTSNKLNRLIHDFKGCGGQAIEVVNQPRHCANITGMAQRAVTHDLYASMGSDFHRPEHTWRGLGWLAPMPQNVKPVWELFKQPLNQS